MFSRIISTSSRVVRRQMSTKGQTEASSRSSRPVVAFLLVTTGAAIHHAVTSEHPWEELQQALHDHLRFRVED